jgi:hypothetical protein
MQKTTIRICTTMNISNFIFLYTETTDQHVFSSLNMFTYFLPVTEFGGEPDDWGARIRFPAKVIICVLTNTVCIASLRSVQPPIKWISHGKVA